MNNQKITSIVFLRAIAALAVCIIHVQMLSGFTANTLIDYLINNCQQGVAIFFVISGFILPYSLYQKNYRVSNFGRFIINRSIRIDPPYWVSILLFIWLTPVAASIINTKVFMLHLFYLVPFFNQGYWFSSIYWTLAIEFQFYILLGLFLPFLMRINVNISLLIIITVSILCIISKDTTRGIIINNFYDFAIGFIVFITYIGRISLSRGTLLLLVFAIYVMLAVSKISGGVPLVTGLFILYYKSQAKVQPLYFMGNISYSLYLVHIPAATLFINNVHSYITHKGILFFGGILASIVAAWLFYILVEQNALKLSRALRIHKQAG